MFTKNVFSMDTLAANPVFALIESLPEQAVLIDPDGRILSINTLFAARFALSLEECIGTSVYDLISTLRQWSKLALHFREKLLDAHPDFKIPFISGYTEDGIADTQRHAEPQ